MTKPELRKAFIHIGFHKTATTYIQECLRLSSEDLIAHGYYYKEWGIGPGHANLAAKISNQDKVETSVLLDYAFCKENDRNNLNPIISSEVLTDASAGVIEKELCDLSKECQIHIIISIRNAVLQAQSLFQEKLKWGHSIRFAETKDWLDIVNTNDISLGYLADIINICERNKFLLHHYDISRESTISIEDRFAKILGLDALKLKTPGKFTNIAHPPITQVILEAINTVCSASEGGTTISFMARQVLANQIIRGTIPINAGLDSSDAKTAREILDARSKNLILCPESIKNLLLNIDQARLLMLREASHHTGGLAL